MTTVVDVIAERSVADATARARDWLLAHQDPEGWWKGELATNVTMDAEDLLLRSFLGVLDERTLAASARWIRSQQRADGTWATFHGGPGDLSTTVEAYLALRLAGDPIDARHMQLAAAFVLDAGGIERTRVFTRVWLALFGLWSWDQLPTIPPEQVLLPPSAPLGIYSFACWARQTIVPLSIVFALRPRRTLPVGLDELRTGADPVRATGLGIERAFDQLDRLLHRYQRHPVRRLRRLALDRAERWILARQEADGGWGGIQPPWVYSLIALHALGRPLDHPAIARGLQGLEGFTVHVDGMRRLEACQSPVWDTALAVIALRDAGVRADDAALVRAGTWLVREEIQVPGDWAVRRPRLAPGGWAFEFANDGYPDIDDAAEVVLALRRLRGVIGARGAAERSIQWMVGMQSRGGGWAAFDADNTSRLPARIPFCDFGEVTDPPSADVTAHVLELLARERLADTPAGRAGIRYLLGEQEQDGSWFGRWGANHLYGTGAAVPALVAAGIGRDDPVIRRAVGFLERVQNADGGWGEDLRSYDDPAWRGRGDATPSQTAWALLALHAAGEARGEAAVRGARFLVDRQRDDGTWDEPQFTGTGFPGDFYINYGLYRHVFPLSALGRLREATP